MPTLSIDIEARFAKFQDGLDKIDRDVSRSVKGMSRSFDTLKSAARGLIGTLVGFGAIRAFKGVIDDLDTLQTISERTGRSAQSLVGFALAAKTSGTDLESFAKGLNKLNVALSDLASGKNAKLKDILLQFGFADFARGAIDAEEALLQLAEIFPRLSDADKAAVAVEFFGEKLGSKLIPGLDGGRESLEKFIETGKKAFPNANKLAKDADAFKDAMEELSFSIKGGLLPTLEVVLPLMKSLAVEFSNVDKDGNLASFARGIAEVFKVVIVLGANVAYVFTTIGKEIGGFAQQLKALARFDFKTIKIIADEMKKQGEEGRKAIDSFTENILFPKASAPGKPAALDLPDFKLKGKTDPAKKAARDNTAQRLLDQQIKAFERSIDQERDLAQTRNDFLQRFYDDGLISLSDYTKARGAILEESANKQKLAIGAEIALLEASKKGKASDDRIAIDTKINDLLEKQADLNRDVAISGQNLFLDNAREARDFADELQRLNIRLLESKGDIEGAARLQFSLDNRDFNTKIDTAAKSGATPEERAAAALGKKRNEELRDRNIEFAKFDVLAEKVNATRNDAADAEERINLAIETGQISQIDGLQQISAIRTKLSEELLTQGELMENIALLTNDKNQIEFLKGLGIEIERVNAALDPLRDKMEDLLSSGVSGFFQDIASGTVSAKQAFKSMIDEFTKRLTAFISDQFFKQLFGEQGALGGVAGLLTGSGGQQQQPQQPQQQGGGFAGALASFFGGQSGTQAAAPISQGVATSLGSGSAGAGADAASALKDVAASSTATSFALQEFSDQGVAGATQSLFENVAASSIEQSAEQTATVSLTALSIATDAATAAMVKQATAQAISGAVQSSAGGFAEGGQVTGPGTTTSDSIPVLLSNREFVVRAKPVQEPGALAFLNRFNRLGMKAMQRYSLGGLVGTTMGMSSPALVAAGGVNLTQNFTVEARTPKETQAQLAASAYSGGMRAFRRNR